MSFHLTIYHNVDSRFFEFEPGDMLKPTDRLAKVMRLDVPDTLLADVNRTLENIYMQGNMDEPTQEWARAYRLAGHRSLSVGDVIQIGETAWAVANMGFKQVSISQNPIVNDHPPDITFGVEREIPEPTRDLLE